MRFTAGSRVRLMKYPDSTTYRVLSNLEAQEWWSLHRYGANPPRWEDRERLTYLLPQQDSDRTQDHIGANAEFDWDDRIELDPRVPGQRGPLPTFRPGDIVRLVEYPNGSTYRVIDYEEAQAAYSRMGYTMPLPNPSEEHGDKIWLTDMHRDHPGWEWQAGLELDPRPDRQGPPPPDAHELEVSYHQGMLVGLERAAQLVDKLHDEQMSSTGKVSVNLLRSADEIRKLARVLKGDQS